MGTNSSMFLNLKKAKLLLKSKCNEIFKDFYKPTTEILELKLLKIHIIFNKYNCSAFTAVPLSILIALTCHKAKCLYEVPL